MVGKFAPKNISLEDDLMKSKKVPSLLVALVCLGLLLFAIPVNAEETKSVMFNPLGLLFGIYNAEYEQVISNDMSFNVAGLVGYKWIFSGGFTTEAAAGVNVSTGTIKTNDSSTPPAGLTGVGPALSLKLGYSF